MQMAATFFEWAVCEGEGVWTVNEGRDYPRLSWEGKPGTVLGVRLSSLLSGDGSEDDPYLIYTLQDADTIGLFPCEQDKHFRLMFLEGEGREHNPYLIRTAGQLELMGRCPYERDAHFKLMANIDLDPNLPGGRVFDKAVIAPDTDPAAGGYQGTPFTGTFDGNGYVISHLTVRGQGYLGLFGQLGTSGTPGGDVKNLGVVDVNIVGLGSPSIFGSGGPVGGLIGLNSRIVTQCYSTGTVSGTGSVGGLVGWNDGVLTSCCSAGAVHGNDNVGGLVGFAGWNASIWDCYSTSSVSGDDSVGGLVGLADWYSECLVCGVWSADISRCYSAGPVSGANRIGGLVGLGVDTFYDFGGERCRWTESFWDMQASAQATSAGGTGKTTAEMQTAKTFLDGGWDFVGETANGTPDIWKIAEGLDYPRLWWEPYDGQVTVVPGQVFTVTLESNPSTGYRWEWVDHQDSIVEQIGQAQFKPRETGDPPLVGAGGWESFDFKAVHQGQMTLKLVYRRPWEEGVEPLKTFSLQVTVP